MAPLALPLRFRDNVPDRVGLRQTRRRILTDDMEYVPPSGMVVILSRVGPVRPDVVESLLDRLDPAKEIRHHWIGSSPEASCLCSGATAIFGESELAKYAAKELQSMSRSIVAVTFSEFFAALVEAEIRLPDFEGHSVRIVVKAKNSLQREQRLSFENSLMDFGPCERIRFYQHSDDYGDICMVHYRYAAHAIAAKCVLNGKDIEETGQIVVQLQITSKVKKIFEYVKHYLA